MYPQLNTRQHMLVTTFTPCECLWYCSIPIIIGTKTKLFPTFNGMFAFLFLPYISVPETTRLEIRFIKNGDVIEFFNTIWTKSVDLSIMCNGLCRFYYMYTLRALWSIFHSTVYGPMSQRVFSGIYIKKWLL